MRKFCICIVLMFFSAFSSCIARGGNGSFSTSKTPPHTKEANRVLATLRKAARHKTPFLGHQDALMYGQNWWINEGDSLYEKSDIYDVCGKYPFILGLDLGRIERGQERNIDRCSFRQMKEAAIMHHKRGGLVTVSWHMDNPVSDSTAWDCTAGNVVLKILHDSLIQKKYLLWLDSGASFLNQLVDEKGRKIPVLFRPLHECNIESFWWSNKSCSKDEYIALWRLTYNYLVNEKNMKQLLWVYSPYNVHTESELSAWYPGDEYVDVIGYERYQSTSNTYEGGIGNFINDVKKGIDVTVKFAKPRAKLVAFTETGYQGIPYDNWWTEGLWASIKKKPIAYVHLWRNGLSKTYYYGPCPSSRSITDFKVLLRTKKIRLLKK